MKVFPANAIVHFPRLHMQDINQTCVDDELAGTCPIDGEAFSWAVADIVRNEIVLDRITREPQTCQSLCRLNFGFEALLLPLLNHHRL